MDMEAHQRRLAVLCSHFRPPFVDSLKSQFLCAHNCSSLSQRQCEIHGLKENDGLRQDCVFCQIIRGQSPAFKVIAAMCSKIPLISDAIKKATGCDSFNLLVNNGAAAGQVIFHTHIHIIPRKACDCLWASESLRRLSLKLDEEASQLAESIRNHLSVASKGEEELKSRRSNLAVDYRD